MLRDMIFELFRTHHENNILIKRTMCLKMMEMWILNKIQNYLILIIRICDVVESYIYISTWQKNDEFIEIIENTWSDEAILLEIDVVSFEIWNGDFWMIFFSINKGPTNFLWWYNFFSLYKMLKWIGMAK